MSAAGAREGVAMLLTEIPELGRWKAVLMGGHRNAHELRKRFVQIAAFPKFKEVETTLRTLSTITIRTWTPTYDRRSVNLQQLNVAADRMDEVTLTHTEILNPPPPLPSSQYSPKTSMGSDDAANRRH